MVAPATTVSVASRHDADGEDCMPTRPGPTVQRRRLGLELRRLREAAGKTLQEVARALECSDSKVSRIETGQVSATPRDVRDMLELYEVPGDRRDALIQVARDARRKGWWQAYGDTPAMPLIGLEVVADRIHQYEAMVVPGLLQTSDYARAMIRALHPEFPGSQVDRWVELRMTRQELLDQDDPPMFVVVVEECVLRRPVGGRPTMRAQLRHLKAAIALPSLTLQVLPLRVGEHAAMNGTFAVYRFSEPADPDVVHFEHAPSDLYLERPEQVERYAAAFDRLRAAALDPDESSRFVNRLARSL
jgi:transcriptional regulator with XRE-family HTH domain